MTADARPPFSHAAIAGIVLAGGRSSRFGADKMFAPLGGQPLIAHAIARLRPQVPMLAISAGGDPASYADFDLPVLPDPIPGFQGPLAGVLGGLLWAKELGFRAIVTAAGDTPVFPEDLVTGLRVAALARLTDIAGAGVPDGRGGFVAHPTFGLWPVRLAEPLAAAIAAGERRLRAFAEAEGAARAIFEDRGVACFHNVNTPGDMARAEEIRR